MKGARPPIRIPLNMLVSETEMIDLTNEWEVEKIQVIDHSYFGGTYLK